ncbi:MAG: ABC-2 transporter permease [Candidatus Viridilinea halotolerans]|uniref:ABC-2 transporter permease n=1 Tax=Candidatus Viridilinea halotolerans TaxID=2491704 RepID=A0A426U3C1_9CHLR|nr:MAG: ABC-2 transporter permease [Candidatus Viridilinea halotolerans]
MQRWLIRVRAYFLKEVNEIRRQPLLILSLIIGPLLVLILFGSTYVQSTPQVRTGLVVPAEGLRGINEEEIFLLIGLNFDLRLITSERAEAEAQLANGELDLVQVLPGNIVTALRSGYNPIIEFHSAAINPMTEGWIQYLAYAQINEINKAILRTTAAQAQVDAADFRVRLTDAEGKVIDLEQNLSEAGRQASRENIRELVDLTNRIEALLPAQDTLTALGPELASMRPTLRRLRSNLQEFEQAIANDTLELYLLEIAQARSDIQLINGSLEIFVNTPPDRLVSPVGQRYTNIRGNAYPAVVYYSPGVLALLVQHTAITLGALALVRERLMGAFEVFRVAPVSLSQMLIGKYLGYTIFIGLASGVLIGAMALLGVPMLGSWFTFGGLLLLLIIASLGIGFLISALSGSDSQAIQLAMISLLLSIFFSGFFIALDSFAPAALPVAYAIPMTHGLAGLQQIMLRGLAPDSTTWLGLSAIASLSFLLVMVITGRQMRQA